MLQVHKAFNQQLANGCECKERGRHQRVGLRIFRPCSPSISHRLQSCHRGSLHVTCNICHAMHVGGHLTRTPDGIPTARAAVQMHRCAMVEPKPVMDLMTEPAVIPAAMTSSTGSIGSKACMAALMASHHACIASAVAYASAGIAMCALREARGRLPRNGAAAQESGPSYHMRH